MTKTLPHPALLVVVHGLDAGHAVGQARLALDAGADGVFLIDHHGGGERIITQMLAAVRQELGDDPWVGINPLGYTAAGGARLVRRMHEAGMAVDGLWADNAGIGRYTDPDDVRSILDGIDCLYFGGVAFKYQQEVTDLEGVAAIAAHHMDYVTTSGPGTGMAIDREKLRRIAEGSGDHPVALASGVSIDNAAGALAYIAAALVNTSVSTSFHHLDPAKVAALAKVFQQARFQAGVTARANGLPRETPEHGGPEWAEGWNMADADLAPAGE